MSLFIFNACINLFFLHFSCIWQLLGAAAKGGEWKPDMFMIHPNVTLWMWEMILVLPNVAAIPIISLCGLMPPSDLRSPYQVDLSDGRVTNVENHLGELVQVRCVVVVCYILLCFNLFIFTLQT